MRVAGHRGPDGLIRVLCPRAGCGKRIKFETLSKPKWVTCPRPECGQRFEAYFPEAQHPPVVADRGRNTVTTTERTRTSLPQAKAPLSQTAERTLPMPWLLAGGGLVVVVLLIVVSLAFVLSRPRNSQEETPIEVAQTPSPKVLPAPPATSSDVKKGASPAKIDPPKKMDAPAKITPPKKADPPPPPPPEPEWIVGEAKQIRLDVANVSAVAFSPDGRQVAFGTKEGRILVRELEAEKTHELLGGGKERITCLAFSANGEKLASGCGGQLGQAAPVRIWHVAEGRVVGTFNHDEQVTGVAFSPDGKRAVSSSLDTTARLWDLENGKEVRWLGPETKRFEQRYGFACAVFSPDGTQVLTGDHPVSIFVSGGRANISASVGAMAMRVWEAETGRAVCRSPVGKGGAKLGHQEEVTAAAYERKGRWAVTASADTTLRKWDPQTGAEQRVFQGHTGAVLCLALSPDGRYLLSGGGKEKESGKFTGRIDSTVRLWEIETGKEIHKFDGHEKEVLLVAFFADGKRAISGSADGTVRVWNLPKEPAAAKSPDSAKAPGQKAPKTATSALVQKLVGTWIAKDGSGLQVTFNDTPAIILKTRQAVQGAFYDLKGEDTLEFTARLGAGFGQRVQARLNEAGDELRIVLASDETISFRKTK